MEEGGENPFYDYDNSCFKTEKEIKERRQKQFKLWTLPQLRIYRRRPQPGFYIRSRGQSSPPFSFIHCKLPLPSAAEFPSW